MKSAPVTTRRGDSGFTSVSSGARLSKASPLIECLGALDECNTALGVARAYLAAKHRYPQVIRHYQQHIYKLMAEVSCRGEKSYFDSRAVKQLEKRIALLRRRAPVKPVFVTPGDSITGAHLHVARTSVRCAERRLVELLEDELVSSKSAVPFLNRLSDFLFVLANYVEQC